MCIISCQHSTQTNESIKFSQYLEKITQDRIRIININYRVVLL